MKRSMYTALAAVVLTALVSSGRAEAQFRSTMPSGALGSQSWGNQQWGPPQNPGGYQAFSPYLNMTRGGTNAAVNYYGMVRPQMQGQQSIQQLQQGQQVLSQQQQAFGLGGLGGTTSGQVSGHTTQFQNYSHYFPSLATGRSASSRR